MICDTIFRKKYLIDEQHQVKLMLLIICYLILYTGFLVLILFLPSIIIILSEFLPLATRFEAGQEFLFIDTIVWPAIAILAALIGLHSIIITHRLFGPLYKIRNTLFAMSQGDFTLQFKMRKHDLLSEYMEELNNCNGSIKNNLKNIMKGQKEALYLIDNLGDLLLEKNAFPEKVTKKIKTIKNKHNKINELLSLFKVSN